MSRCAVCSEKAYVNLCGHCDKKVCETCRDAHCDILKREISRINNQVRRGLHRIEEALLEVCGVWYLLIIKTKVYLRPASPLITKLFLSDLAWS